MGNSVGNLEEYWNAIRSEDNMLGGFVWDWVDQARAVSLSDLGKTYKVTDKTGIEASAIGDESDWHKVTEVDSLNNGRAFSGYTIMDNSSKYNDSLSGTGKSFTFEAIVNPASSSRNNILIAKGDYQVALKTQSTSDGLEFFIYDDSGNGSWKSVSTTLPDDWVGNWHQVVGVYDKGLMTLYYDGKKLAENTVADKISSSSNPIGIGYDKTYGRTLDGMISIARIYNKALTKEEIEGQRNINPAIGSDDNSVLLWLDYADEYETGKILGWDYYAEDYAHTNLYKEEIKGKFYGYGGDFGDSPNDDSFCENGILSPDRTEQPELKEVKYQYQDFWFKADLNDLDNRKVNVVSENDAKNLNEYTVKWDLLENGISIDEGIVEDIDIQPQGTGTINVPFKLPENPSSGSEYYLNISVELKEDTFWADKGFEIGKEQIKVPVEVQEIKLEASENKVEIEEGKETYQVKGKNFSFDIDKATGVFKNYTYNDEVLITEGPSLHFWRGLLENDKVSYDSQWSSATENLEVSEITTSENELGLKEVVVNINLPNAKDTKATVIYTINGDGEITVSISVDASKNNMGNFIKVGSVMTLPEGFENVVWYGNGPVESFVDRKTNTKQGIWENTVDRFFYPYLKVDESGNLTDVNWITLENKKLSSKLLIVAANKVEASASRFTADDINAVTHPYELTPRKETILNVNYGSMGTGGATCGPGPLTQYQLPSDKVYEWEYTILPVNIKSTAEEITEIAKPYHNVEAFSRDEYFKGIADEVIERIDSFVVYSYSQLDEINQLFEDYNKLPEDAKHFVNLDINREELLKKYVEDVKGLKFKETYILDKSKNKMEIPYRDTVSFSKNDGKVYMEGTLEVPFNDILSPVFEGPNSFTVEVGVIPTGYIDYNMFAGKGDNSFALRIRKERIDFHIYAGGAWRSMEIEMDQETSNNMLNKFHQFVGIYNHDTHKIQVYLDGKLLSEKATNTTEGVAPSTYNFTIGGCPSTGRKSMAQFEFVRVYNKALTNDEVSGQINETPKINYDDEKVELWFESKNLIFIDIPADKTELESLINEVLDMDLSLYLTATVEELNTVLEDAKAVMADEKANQDDVNQILLELQTAIDNLELKPITDKTLLREKLDSINDLDLSQKTEETVEILTNLVDEAEALYINDEATQAEIDKMILDLDAAIEGLVDKENQVDKESLQTTIEIAESIPTSPYTDESVKILKDALAKAKEVNEKEDATKEEITKAIEDILSAIEGLEAKEVKPEEKVDKQALKAVIEDLEKLDLSGYTDESKEVFEKAIEDAKKILADEKASLEDVNGQIVALIEAKNKLVEKEEEIEIGWKEIDGTWYYYKEDGSMAKSEFLWLEVGEDSGVFNYKFFNSKGESIDQFYEENGSTWLSKEGPTSTYVKGWWTDSESGLTYFFRETSGTRVTGWQYIDGSWRYFRTSGSMVTSRWEWLKVEGSDKYNWKFFNYKGESIDQFRSEGNNSWLSQAGPSTEYARGWKTLSGYTYFFRETSGTRVTGWQFIDGAWRYFRESGTMVTGRQFIDGKWYVFDKDGSLVK